MNVYEFNGMFLAIFITVVGFIISMITITVKISTLLNKIEFSNRLNTQVIDKLLTRMDALEDNQLRTQYNCMRHHPDTIRQEMAMFKAEDPKK